MPIEPASPLTQARELFVREGLPFPWIPDGFAERLQSVGEFLFSTRPLLEAGPYHIEFYRDEVLDSTGPDYVLLGFDGRGVNSWALHYFLVSGPLALFLQIPWGGAYTNPDEARAEIQAMFGHLEPLWQGLEQARSHGRLAVDEQMVVIDSAFVRSDGVWLNRTSRQIQRFWQPQPDILSQARAAVVARLGG